MINGQKIQETFLDFLEEHPEIHLVHGNNNDVIIEPADEKVEGWSCTNVLGNILLYYTYGGINICFSGNMYKD